MNREVCLEDMLNAREARAAMQRRMTDTCKSSLISFTMNIAGPVKSSPLILRGFEEGVKRLKGRLCAAGLKVLCYKEIRAFTGNEAFFAVDCEPLELKRITCDTEDFDALGRLFDMDVLSESGQKIDRQDIEQAERRCLICGCAAKECARSRTHSVELLQEKTAQILNDAFKDIDSETIACQAVRALLYEAAATPKPGLVDRINNGSHSDMDIFTFITSSCTLNRYFLECAKTGIETRTLPAKKTFEILRRLGRHAEAKMFISTEGVNTHKGAIFSLGTLCGALGRVSFELRQDTNIVLNECAKMTQGLSASSLKKLSTEAARTTGEKLFIAHGIGGIREQAEKGFPAVRDFGLPVLEEGRRRGLSLNDAGCSALLAIIANETDTNIIKRSNIETCHKISAKLKKLLDSNPFPDLSALQKLDDEFTALNISPGGSADLLAMSYLLYFIKNI